MADLDAIKRRLKALLEMTSANGCTDAEAEAAAAKAAQLIQEHNLRPEDLEMEVESVDTTSRSTVMDHLWLALATMTNCVLMRRDEWDGAKLDYIGAGAGPAVATYLHTYLHRHVEAAVRRYKATPEYKRKRKGPTRRRACEAFRAGMVARLIGALKRHFQVDEKLLERAQKYRSDQYETREVAIRKPSTRQDRAVAAGYAAGSQVEIRDGVGGGPVGLIGNR